MNNKLITIQEMLMREMKRLDKDNVSVDEITKSNALSNSAITYLKAVNTSIRIKEMATKNGQTMSSITKELGINND